MKISLLVVSILFTLPAAFGQFELSTGYAVNKNEANGPALHIAYDIKVKDRFYLKPQLGCKYLYHFNDFVGAKISVFTFEIHQTFSYEIIKRNKYVLKPNVGFNYRFYYWKGKMVPPLNTLPQRVYIIEFRDDRLRLNSFDGGDSHEYRVNNIGFSFQLQNQFKIKNKIWIHITPFLEPDYDRIQNTGGCYAGIIFKQD